MKADEDLVAEIEPPLVATSAVEVAAGARAQLVAGAEVGAGAGLVVEGAAEERRLRVGDHVNADVGRGPPGCLDELIRMTEADLVVTNKVGDRAGHVTA